MTETTTLPATFREWIDQQFDADQLRDIATHGCVVGVPGLTYYNETVLLYDAYHKDIWEHLYYDAQDHGYTPLEFIGTFNGNPVTDAQFKNLLVWYYVEALAKEQNDEEKE